jgi:glycosyltransferase involved in cell wall biosynthesis
MPLKFAAKVDAVDEGYFREVIHPLLDRPNITFIGEISERQKTQFLGEANALLFPIDWPEPFGLVLIEAMACATPVLAFRGGSVPEVIEPGGNGMIVDSVEEAVAMAPQVMRLNRREVRRMFEQRFSARRMAHDYVRLFTAAREADAVSRSMERLGKAVLRPATIGKTSILMQS